MHSAVVVPGQRHRSRLRGALSVQLIVGLAVIAVVTGLTIPTMFSAYRNARAADASATLAQVAAAQDAKYVSEGSYVSFSSGAAAQLTPPGVALIDGEDESTSDDSISMLTGQAGSVPFVALATRSSGGCVSLIRFPASAKRKDITHKDTTDAFACSAVQVATDYNPDLKGESTAKPAAPTGVVAASAPNAVHVSWNAVPGARGYRVYSRSLPTGEFVVRADAGASTSYVDAGHVFDASVKQEFEYFVVAYSTGGTSRQSALARGVVGGPKSGSPAKVSGLVLVSSDASGVRLAWDLDTDQRAVAYRVVRDSMPIAELDQEDANGDGHVFATTFHDQAAVAEGATYSYRVLAIGGDGVPSVASKTLKVQLPPAMPKRVQATPGVSGGCLSQLCVDIEVVAPESSVSEITVYRCVSSGNGCEDQPAQEIGTVSASPGQIARVRDVSPPRSGDVVYTAGASFGGVESWLRRPSNAIPIQDDPPVVTSNTALPNGSFTVSWTVRDPKPTDYVSVQFFDGTGWLDVLASAPGATSVTGNAVDVAAPHRLVLKRVGTSVYASDDFKFERELTAPTPVLSRVAATLDTPTHVSVTWSAEPGTSYEVIRDNVVVSPKVAGGKWLDFEPVADVNIEYKVRATRNGLSSTSAVQHIAGLQIPPTGLRAIPGTTNSPGILLTWDESAHGPWKVIECATVAMTGTSCLTTVVHSPSYEAKVITGTRYFTVASRNGTSAVVSAPSVFNLPSDMSISPSVADGVNLKYTFSWKQPALATAWILYRQPALGGSVEQMAEGAGAAGSTQSVADVLSPEDADYEWFVRASYTGQVGEPAYFGSTTRAGGFITRLRVAATTDPQEVVATFDGVADKVTVAYCPGVCTPGTDTGAFSGKLEIPVEVRGEVRFSLPRPYNYSIAVAGSVRVGGAWLTAPYSAAVVYANKVPSPTKLRMEQVQGTNRVLLTWQAPASDAITGYRVTNRGVTLAMFDVPGLGFCQSGEFSATCPMSVEVELDPSLSYQLAVSTVANRYYDIGGWQGAESAPARFQPGTFTLTPPTVTPTLGGWVNGFGVLAKWDAVAPGWYYTLAVCDANVANNCSDVDAKTLTGATLTSYVTATSAYASVPASSPYGYFRVRALHPDTLLGGPWSAPQMFVNPATEQLGVESWVDDPAGNGMKASLGWTGETGGPWSVKDASGAVVCSNVTGTMCTTSTTYSYSQAAQFELYRTSNLGSVLAKVTSPVPPRRPPAPGFFIQGGAFAVDGEVPTSPQYWKIRVYDEFDSNIPKWQVLMDTFTTQQACVSTRCAFAHYQLPAQLGVDYYVTVATCDTYGCSPQSEPSNTARLSYQDAAMRSSPLAYLSYDKGNTSSIGGMYDLQGGLTIRGNGVQGSYGSSAGTQGKRFRLSEQPTREATDSLSPLGTTSSLWFRTTDADSASPLLQLGTGKNALQVTPALKRSQPGTGLTNATIHASGIPEELAQLDPNMGYLRSGDTVRAGHQQYGMSFRLNTGLSNPVLAGTCPTYRGYRSGFASDSGCEVLIDGKTVATSIGKSGVFWVPLSAISAGQHSLVVKYARNTGEFAVPEAVKSEYRNKTVAVALLANRDRTGTPVVDADGQVVATVPATSWYADAKEVQLADVDYPTLDAAWGRVAASRLFFGSVQTQPPGSVTLRRVVRLQTGRRVVLDSAVYPAPAAADCDLLVDGERHPCNSPVNIYLTAGLHVVTLSTNDDGDYREQYVHLQEPGTSRVLWTMGRGAAANDFNDAGPLMEIAATSLGKIGLPVPQRETDFRINFQPVTVSALTTSQFSARLPKMKPDWRVIGVRNAAPYGESGAQPLNDGRWHHLAVVDTKDNIFIYVDGALHSLWGPIPGFGARVEVSLARNFESSSDAMSVDIDEFGISGGKFSPEFIRKLAAS